MNVNVPLEIYQLLVPTAEITEAGDYFRMTSRAAIKYGVTDYVVTLVPRSLPLDGNRHVVTPGDFRDIEFPEIKHALGGCSICMRTGKFTPPTKNNPTPIFELTHPAEATDVALHVLWDRNIGKPPYDGVGKWGVFGCKYHVSWYRRYPAPPQSSDLCGEDVWVMPVSGPIQPIVRYYADVTDRLIADGNAATQASLKATPEYQAEKAKYRQELEASNLIARFNAACGSYEIVIQMGEDEVNIFCPHGVDTYPYDERLLLAIQTTVEHAELVNCAFDDGLPPAERIVALTTAIFLGQ